MADRCPDRGEEPVGVSDAVQRIKLRLDGRVVVRRQALDLLDVEDGVGLQERDLALDVLAILVGLGALEPVGVDDGGAVLALCPHLGVEYLSCSGGSFVGSKPSVLPSADVRHL
jgi:hypothetical protein